MEILPKKDYSFMTLFREGEFELPIGSVIQVEELAMNNGEVMSSHIQSCHEITCVISGRAKVFYGDECITVEAGDVNFVSSGLEHSLVVESDKKFRFICIGVMLNKEYADLEKFIKIIDKTKSFTIKDSGDIRILSEMLLNEFYSVDDMSKILINSYLNQIFALLCRGYSKSKTATLKNTWFGVRSDYVLYNILRYIDREYMNIVSVKEIAKKFLYNENYLAHLFTDKLGISVKQYVVQKKILAAEKLLTETNLSIEDIATQLSFSTAHSFYQAFKRYHDISPLQYRKKNSP